MDTVDLASHADVFEVAHDLGIGDPDLAARVADYIVAKVEHADYGGQINAIRDLLDVKPGRKSISVKAIRDILAGEF